MRVIELFAGLGACSKALKNIGIDVEIVDAVEIDKYAIASFNAIHGTHFEPQDIRTWNKDYENIDLIMHGSPCQDFSIAGKQAGGDKDSGTRSSLMYETIRIVEKIKPRFVVWENVKNILSKKHIHNFNSYLAIMDELGYNNYSKVLNAKDYGIPQNRERVFTISIRKDLGIDFKFPEPEELKLRLKDMLEAEVDEKYYLSDKMLAFFERYTEKQKKKGNGFKFETTEGDCVAKSITTRVGACRTDDNYIKLAGKLNIKGHDCIKRVYSQEGLSPTLTDMQGGNRQPKIISYNIPQTVSVRKYDIDIKKLKTVLRESKKITNREIATKLNVPQTKVEHWFRSDSSFSIPDKDVWYDLKKLLNIDTTEFDEAITTFEERDGVYEKSNRCYLDAGISPTITSASADEKIITGCAMRGRYDEDGKVQQHIELSNREYANAITTVQKDSLVKENEAMRIRKLTPKECWRLMGFSDEDFDKAAKINSNTQLYKQAGNSIVVKVLEKIFNNLKENI